MCGIISNQAEANFARDTRAVRISGHITSVQLENYFWRVLEAIAKQEELSLPRLLNKLNEEFVTQRGNPPSNFASMLRVGCIKFVKHHPNIF